MILETISALYEPRPRLIRTDRTWLGLSLSPSKNFSPKNLALARSLVRGELKSSLPHARRNVDEQIIKKRKLLSC